MSRDAAPPGWWRIATTDGVVYHALVVVLLVGSVVGVGFALVLPPARATGKPIALLLLGVVTVACVLLLVGVVAIGVHRARVVRRLLAAAPAVPATVVGHAWFAGNVIRLRLPDDPRRRERLAFVIGHRHTPALRPGATVTAVIEPANPKRALVREAFLDD